MDANGSLATLRHGFKCYGRTLHGAYFKAAHELNPELEECYAKNRLGLTRQLHFSTRSEKSLDVTLSVNGIPIATLELKNAMTGQTVEDARRQYKQDRDPREPIFEFKKRTLVHFAVDTDAVFMTTRLAGNATHFYRSIRATAEAQETRPTRRVAATAPPTSGKRCSRGIACSTCSRASCICRSTRSATTRATR
jgi:type I site-specific restriction-modification system R (restriction) subunit